MVQNFPVYIDYLYLMDSIKEYSSPKSKLTNMIKSKEIIKIKRGLYLNPESKSFSKMTLANKIYGPSYISFESALSYYNMIPERVNMVTSASLDKNKSKIFETQAGVFSYKSISSQVYPYGIVRIEEDGSPFLIAEKEKALCDTLSKISGIGSLRALEILLYDDMRFDKSSILNLNLKDIEFLEPLYKRKIISIFLNYLKEERNA